MALVNRNAANGAAGMLASYIWSQTTSISQREAENLANAIIGAARDAGSTSAQVIGDAVREYSTHWGNTVRNGFFREIEGLQSFSRNIVTYVGDALQGGQQDHVPDIGDLIPNSDTGGAQVGDTRNRQGDTVTSGREQTRARDRARLDARAHEMDQPMEDAPQLEAARAAGPGGGSSVSKETQISPYPSLSYGLQETHTTVLPWVGWCSTCNLDKDTPTQLKIRMNSINDFIDVTLSAVPAAGQVPAKGFYRDPLNWYGGSNSDVYPQALANHGTAGTSERPQWKAYWDKIYDYWTVLGCEWKIIVRNPTKLENYEEVAAGAAAPAIWIAKPASTDVAVAVQYDVYSDTATTTGNVMPSGTTYEECRNYKNIEWYGVKSQETTIITGKYKPGQTKRNIVNDGDVKTWTKTDGSQPNLKEILTVNFWKGPLANIPNTTTKAPGCNLEIQVNYIVQYKDLKLQARYPNSSSVAGTFDISQILSNSNTTGDVLARWV